MVVRAGLMVDVLTDEEYRGRLLAWSDDPDDPDALKGLEIDEEVARRAGGLTLTIRPFADTDSGERVFDAEGTWEVDHMGFFVAIADGDPLPDMAVTEAGVEATVREDAFEDGMDASDRWLGVANALDGALTPEQLDALPFTIELTDRLRATLPWRG